MNDEYTPAILAIKCPKCLGVGKCLDPKRDGSEFRESPHKERVEAAKGEEMTDVARPQDTTGMTSEDATIYRDRRAASSSIAAKSNAQIIAEANDARNTLNDPLSRTGIMQEENIPGFVPGKRPLKGVKISTEADPTFANTGLKIGDRVYHKVKRCEGTVKDIMASGTAYVDLDNGVKGKTKLENIVKL